jgi:hypothetical protein
MKVAEIREVIEQLEFMKNFETIIPRPISEDIKEDIYISRRNFDIIYKTENMSIYLLAKLGRIKAPKDDVLFIVTVDEHDADYVEREDSMEAISEEVQKRIKHNAPLVESADDASLETANIESVLVVYKGLYLSGYTMPWINTFKKSAKKYGIKIGHFPGGVYEITSVSNNPTGTKHEVFNPWGEYLPSSQKGNFCKVFNSMIETVNPKAKILEEYIKNVYGVGTGARAALENFDHRNMSIIDHEVAKTNLKHK